ncbi:MAG TPA: sorbosone dehydrogenase family protein [Casimicrobiaceae bacterium]|nr:sorbosone dehydrogenase family protein [Casimicrobiaceae bacterium]
MTPRHGLVTIALLAGCSGVANLPVERGMGADPVLPAPDRSLLPVVEVATATGWPQGRSPQPAAGLAVTRFAGDLDHPRWLHVLPNGDVLVAESAAPPRPDEGKGIKAWFMQLFMKKAGSSVPSANRITLLRDTDGDGVADVREVFADRLNSPFGMALVGNDFYVANTDAIVRFGYTDGALKAAGPPQTITDLPAGTRNHHWTKSLIASRDGTRLYATVGSNSNVAENGMAAEEGRAAIWEIDRGTGAKRLFATGLRNPNGLAWEPDTGALWTAVNERDELGSDLVPDFMTSVRDGGFYGWPYSYFGPIVDTRVEPPRPDLVARAIKPDYALGPHTASLGLATSRGAKQLPPAYANGMFVGQHGSWNRKPPSGYKVIFVPFAGGRPSGPAQDVLTGFLSGTGEAFGRPVGVAVDGRGGLLVADDVGNAVWRLAAAK